MKSMTGYARVLTEENGREISVEIRAVNHRYLDINTRLPHALIPFDDAVRKTVSAFISRGHLDIFINFSDRNENAKRVVANTALAQNLLAAAGELKERFGLKDDFQLSALMRAGDVISYQTDETGREEIYEQLSGAVTKACAELDCMRAAEGQKLSEVIAARLTAVEELVAKIEEHAPEVVSAYRDKLRQRITEALSGVEIDEARLINEVAFFVDKAGIQEETDRLESHIAQMRALLPSGCAGRKMDFLIQEFNREANTICSKSNSVVITRYGVELKNEIEKIREQIQNVE